MCIIGTTVGNPLRTFNASELTHHYMVWLCWTGLGLAQLDWTRLHRLGWTWLDFSWLDCARLEVTALDLIWHGLAWLAVNEFLKMQNLSMIQACQEEKRRPVYGSQFFFALVLLRFFICIQFLLFYCLRNMVTAWRIASLLSQSLKKDTEC